MKTYNIAVIPGDGIGQEVVPEAIRILNALSDIEGGFSFQYNEFPWGCEYYVQNGEMMPEKGLDQLKDSDAIFLGAVGDPTLVPDHISLGGLLLKIRREFEQSVNVRPAKKLKGLDSPLTDPGGFDVMVIRENSEGEYSSSGGRTHSGQDEVVVQNSVFTRKAVSRVMRYAFDLASEEGKKVTSATKSNGIVHSMPFWDEVLKEVSEDYPEIETKSEHIDALAAGFVTKPAAYEVVVASNLFGDILTDIGAAIMGSIGIAPAGNINLNGKYPSMFEPVHGSAPDIKGNGIANPIGQVWTAKMMLDHLGESEAADKLMKAIEKTLDQGIKTRDIGGSASTQEVVDAMIASLQEA